MATVQESIEVNVPLSQAYNQWTQFEEFPHFMSGVESVRQIDDTTVHFSTSIGGVKREYDARIALQEPDRMVTWESLDEPRNAGTVRFEPLGADQTKVTVELVWEPDSAAEKIGAAVGLDSRQVSSDLQRFKKFIEERDVETGAWRGRVEPGGAVDSDSGTMPGTTTGPLGTGTTGGTGTTTGPTTGTTGGTGPTTGTTGAGTTGGTGPTTGPTTGTTGGTGTTTGPLGAGTTGGTGTTTGPAAPVEDDWGSTPATPQQVNTDPDLTPGTPTGDERMR